MKNELIYPALVLLLFVVPKVLARFRIPTGITAFAIGIGFGSHLPGLTGDPVIQLLATFGIISLFLFAGLEVDFDELRQSLTVILQHIGLKVVALVILTFAIMRVLNLDDRMGLLLALALITPSTGFIIDSLDSMKIADDTRHWVKSKAIAAELVAISIMFFALQSQTTKDLSISILGLGTMIAILPFLFHIFVRFIAPFAPKSEFAFLLVLALFCGILTRKLGAYYLVGAFLVGIVAHRFKALLPAIGSDTLIHSTSSFASFFIPFYFFKAGLGISSLQISTEAFVLGFGFLVVIGGARFLLTVGHRTLVLKESFRGGTTISMMLLPTLIFGLVLSEILREEFQMPDWIVGGLVIYTIFITLIPSLSIGAILLPTIPGELNEK